LRFISVNGHRTELCSALDRGLQFGDGVFETMLCVDGVPLDFDEHWARLQQGCERLGIAYPEVRSEVLASVRDCGVQRSVAKLTVTRGVSERGYRSPSGIQPSWVLMVSDAPTHPTQDTGRGVRVKMCSTRVSIEDPRLVGVKHLNRLPQVLARAEWQDEYHEGLVSDPEGFVVEGCSSNLFVVSGNALITPDLSRAGVWGIVRRKVLTHAALAGISCEVKRLERADLERADEVFLTNSVFGIVPVASIEHRSYRIGPVTRRLLAELCTGTYF
jgi:4-amino-4-deoxychorismate lyase